nr:phage tail protein [Citrobacter sp. CFNIH10]
MINWPSVVLPDNTSLGVKYLRLNGASFSKTLYPKLGAIYTSGVLPDVRGDVVRGYDDGRGIDQGRAILSEQADAIQNITATLNVRGMPGLSTGLLFSASGAFSLSSGTGASVLGATGATSSTAMDVLSFSAENVARTATETRMRNMAWNMIVRAT